MPSGDKLKRLTCLEGQMGQEPLLDEIQRDVERSSVLEAMKSYIDQLKGKLDNNARPYQKLARLFMAGSTPERVEGHHDGEAIGLRTGDEHGLLAAYGNFMGLVWGTVVGPVAPWVGKSFDPVDTMRITNMSISVRINSSTNDWEASPGGGLRRAWRAPGTSVAACRWRGPHRRTGWRCRGERAVPRIGGPGRSPG